MSMRAATTSPSAKHSRHVVALRARSSTVCFASVLTLCVWLTESASAAALHERTAGCKRWLAGSFHVLVHRVRTRLADSIQAFYRRAASRSSMMSTADGLPNLGL